MSHSFCQGRPHDRGFVLITTIILLLVVTLLALGAMSISSIQTKIATSSADSQVAFQTAEGALGDAENTIRNGTFSAIPGNGFYLTAGTGAPLWNALAWSDPSVAFQSFQGGSRGRGAFVIEQLPAVISPGCDIKDADSGRVYRITARAVGPSGGSPVTLQSTIDLCNP